MLAVTWTFSATQFPRMSEDLENDEALRSLYEIFKSIWMLNQGEIYEILFKQEYIFVSKIKLDWVLSYFRCANLNLIGSEKVRIGLVPWFGQDRIRFESQLIKYK